MENTKEKEEEIDEEQESQVIDIRPLKEAQTSQVLVESILSQLATGIGGYLVGKHIAMKIMGPKDDIQQLKSAIVNLKTTIDKIRNK